VSTLRRLGRGWRFPVAPSPEGDLEYADGPAKVAQAIRILLDTEPGERVMRPSFGCGLRRYLMQPNTVATRTLMRSDIETALATWEPRIALEAVAVEAADEPSLVMIHIAYTHLRDGRPDNLVFPFYLE